MAKHTTSVLALVLAGLAWVSPGAWAAEYYVSTEGSDSNTGAQSAPFGSIAHALSVAGSGDTVLVGPGLYQEGDLRPASGVTVKNAASDRPLLRPEQGDAVFKLPGGTDGVTLDGLILDGGNANGDRIVGWPIFATVPGLLSNNTVRNSEIRNGRDNCVLIDGERWTFEGNHIHDCGGAQGPLHGHGLYNGSSHSRIVGNLFERAECYNIQNYGGDSHPTDNVYEGNTFKDSNCGVTLSQGANHVFRNNTMVNDGASTDGGLLLGAPNTVVEGNTLMGTNLKTINNNAQGSRVMNNAVCNAAAEVADGATEEGTSSSCDGAQAAVPVLSAPSRASSTPTSQTTAPPSGTTARPGSTGDTPETIATKALLQAAEGLATSSGQGILLPPPRELRVLPPRRASR